MVIVVALFRTGGSELVNLPGRLARRFVVKQAIRAGRRWDDVSELDRELGEMNLQAASIVYRCNLVK